MGDSYSENDRMINNPTHKDSAELQKQTYLSMQEKGAPIMNDKQ